MKYTNESILVKLSELVPSPYNVRRHPHGGIDELAALIDAQGLLHPLTVHEHVVGRGPSRKPVLAVSAGERRRRALLLLQRQGKLPADHEVACRLITVERAREVSVAENSGREPMHPADEFEAFKALVDEGRGIDDVAARFGVSPLVVQRRLRLAAVSPRLLAMYRQDDKAINLDQLMALAISEDTAAQERAWFDAHEWERSPAALKRRLTAGEVEAAGHALVRFVGIEAYEAAGGSVRRDLFDDEQGRFLCDPELLRQLATDKLEGIAGTLRPEGWAWVEARIELDSQALRQFTPCEHTLRPPNPTEEAELAELASREAELQRESDELQGAQAWEGDEAERIALEEEDIEARRRAIRAGLKVWSPQVMAYAGAIVTVSREGDAQIIRGLLREADRKTLEASQRQARKQSTTRPVHEPAEDTCAAPIQPVPMVHYSEALLRRLAAHRTMAMQAQLLTNPRVALAALTHTLLRRAFIDDHIVHRPVMQISATGSAHALLDAATDLKASPAFTAVEAARTKWRERLPQQRDEWIGWLIELPQSEVLELLTLCAALTVNALPNAGTATDANDVARALGLDLADWWEPSAEGFLNHISKSQIVQVLKEARPDLGLRDVEGMKKNALARTAEGYLKGKRWLPPTLRLPAS